MNVKDLRIVVLLACISLCQACFSSHTDYFNPYVTVTEGVTEIPQEGGDYYFIAASLQMRQVSEFHVDCILSRY